MDTKTGDIKEIRQYLQAGGVAINDMGYDAYGNLLNIIGPSIAKGQSFRVDYVFDDQVHQFAVKSTNSFGYSSQAIYDYRFARLLSTSVLNNNAIQYKLDDI